MELHRTLQVITGLLVGKLLILIISISTIHWIEYGEIPQFKVEGGSSGLFQGCVTYQFPQGKGSVCITKTGESLRGKRCNI